MTMFIKYVLIFCLIVVFFLLVFYTYNEKETILAAKNTSAPALRRFSQSRMAQGIKVLPAQIQLEDGKMIAVTKDRNGNQREGSTAACDNSPKKINNSGAVVSTPGKKDRIAAISFLYLLANAHKSRLYR